MPTQAGPVVAVVAGGKGRRHYPLTKHTPKCLLRWRGRSCLESIFLAMRQEDFEDCVLIGHHLFETLQHYVFLLDGRPANLKLIREDYPCGTGGCLQHLATLDAELFIIIFGDVFFTTRLRDLLDAHLRYQPVMTLGVADVAIPIPYGVVLSRCNRILSFEEKPTRHLNVFAGVAIIEPSLFPHIHWGNCFGFDHLVQCALENNLSVRQTPLTGWTHLSSEHVSDLVPIGSAFELVSDACAS